MTEREPQSPELRAKRALDDLLNASIDKDADGEYKIPATITAGDEYLHAVRVNLPVNSTGRTALQSIGGERVFIENQYTPADLLTIVVSEAAFRHGSHLSIKQAQALYERVSSHLSHEAIRTENHDLRTRFWTEVYLRSRLIMLAQFDNPNLTHDDHSRQQAMHRALFGNRRQREEQAKAEAENEPKESAGRERLRKIGRGMLRGLAVIGEFNQLMWGGYAGPCDNGKRWRRGDADDVDPDEYGWF